MEFMKYDMKDKIKQGTKMQRRLRGRNRNKAVMI